MSVITILASWYGVVLGCFGSRAGCCVKLGIFQASTSLGCWMIIPLRICCFVSTPLRWNLHMPCDSTDQNLRSCNDFRILIPYNTWFMYTTWMRVGFAFRSYIPTAWEYWGKGEGTEGELKRLFTIVLPIECDSLLDESQTNLYHVPVSLQLLETFMPLLCLLWCCCRGMNSKNSLCCCV